ncbi:MAG: nuclear transport factor 2 family protein [Elusimicrobia bacterium]|nr:nuclear transport factor 2 family protein [Elusimicrobiota bacterium]MBP9699141.1 nuclear transport factor 2 family protein [Elusimicrobiota bacterium]
MEIKRVSGLRTNRTLGPTMVAICFLSLGVGQALAGDREEVAALVHSFAARGDQSDGAAFRALFVNQPTVSLGTKGPLSSDVFFSAWAKRMNEFKTLGAVRRQHVTTLVVEPPAGGKVTATASLLTTIVQNNEIQLADTGNARFEAVKVGGAWKIKTLGLSSDTTRLDMIRLEMNNSTDLKGAP